LGKRIANYWKNNWFSSIKIHNKKLGIMGKDIVYWKQRDGRLVSVDDMDTNHVRNALKHLIKHHNTIVQRANKDLKSFEQ